MDIIIYGAGFNGEKVYKVLKRFPENRIVSFVDKSISKQGKCMYCGIDVISPDRLTDFDRNIRIVVSVNTEYKEIKNDLIEHDFTNVVGLAGLNYDDQYERKYLYSVLGKNRCIDLGNLLSILKGDIIRNIPFAGGGSGILDYAFLKALAIKFSSKTYLEIGTYIGTSINIMSDVCEKCYGITAPVGSEYSMRKWCMERGIPDYSSALTHKSNIQMFYGDSKKTIPVNEYHETDIFFIDGDHSYSGVCCDTVNVFNHRKKDSIVVWHDFKNAYLGSDVILAVKDSLGSEFDNVYITDNNICGVYIPDNYKEELPLTVKDYKDSVGSEMYVYDWKVGIHKIEV